MVNLDAAAYWMPRSRRGMTAESVHPPSCHSAPVLPDGANDILLFPKSKRNINDFRRMPTVHGVVFAFFVGGAPTCRYARASSRPSEVIHADPAFRAPAAHQGAAAILCHTRR